MSELKCLIKQGRTEEGHNTSSIVMSFLKPTDGESTHPVFARIYNRDLVATGLVVVFDPSGGFSIISERHHDFISSNEDHEDYGWAGHPLGSNPKFLEQLAGATMQFNDEIGELEAQVDKHNRAFIILTIPATKEPPAMLGQVQITREIANKLLACIKRGHHVLEGQIIAPSGGGRPFNLGICCDCQTVAARM